MAVFTEPQTHLYVHELETVDAFKKLSHLQN
jgi:hypothetical protein